MQIKNELTTNALQGRDAWLGDGKGANRINAIHRMCRTHASLCSLIHSGSCIVLMRYLLIRQVRHTLYIWFGLLYVDFHLLSSKCVLPCRDCRRQTSSAMMVRSGWCMAERHVQPSGGSTGGSRRGYAPRFSDCPMWPPLLTVKTW